jgi:Flp pilus assembly protein TadD
MADNSNHKGGLFINGLLSFFLITVGIAAYSNSFNCVFLFDDAPNIVDNPNIRQLWPLTKAMSAPVDSGLGGRPVLSLSFALNYAFGKYNVWGYHFVNLAIHILGALALYGIVRRTLLTDRLKIKFGRHSAYLAFIIAAIWLAHPIQTESVIYIVQRAESLMGLFYLLTVYTAIRAMQPNHSRLWPVVAVVFCALGMGTKEVMVTAPVLVLFYDRTFVSGSFLAALRRRLSLYIGLAATWIALAAATATAPPSGTIGFSVAISPIDYLLNQPLAIVKYLKLCFWPGQLCIYYSWPVILKVWKLILPSLFVVVVLVVITLYGFIRNRVWSYPAVWFCAILAPTSTFVPIQDIIFEHRVYLSLAGLAVMVVLGGYRLLGSGGIKAWLGAGTALVIITVLTVRTFYRNEDYKSEFAIWKSAAKASPSQKAYYNFANFCRKLDKIPESVEYYKKALRLNPEYVNAHKNLGDILKSQNNLNEAAAHYNRILQIEPNHVEAHFNLGTIFQMQNKLDRAENYYRRTLELDPNHINTYNNLGGLLLIRGHYDQAMKNFNRVLEIDPNNAKADNNIAYAIISRADAAQHDVSRALELARRAAELTDSNDPEILDTLADCYYRNGQADLAVQTAEKAIEWAVLKDNKQLADSIRKKLPLYKKQSP